MLRALNQVGITVVFVTHLYELAHRFESQHSSTTLFLRAVRAVDGRSTFQLHEAAPQPTSYGADLYSRTFTTTSGA